MSTINIDIFYMNIFIIGILVLIIIFVLYYASMYYSLDYILKNPIPLKRTTRYVINVKEFDAPASMRYYYESWVFIDSNMPVDKYHILFNRGTDFVVSLKGSSLYIHTGGVVNTDGTYTPAASPVMFEVTKQFPFQKWAHLVFNVDGRTIDAYLDGKLLRSTVMASNMTVTSEADIVIGNNMTEGKITRFRRTGTSISPQAVYNSYMLGSGQSTSASDYHVKIGFLKNDTVRREIELF